MRHADAGGQETGLRVMTRPEIERASGNGLMLVFNARTGAPEALIVWARDRTKARAVAVDGFTIDIADTVDDLAARCNLIVTTTAARSALIRTEMIRPGTHVTAVGADAPGKQELDAALFARAHVLAVDSRSQCIDHGDSAHAVNAGVPKDRFVELGEIIASPNLGRTREDQITIADLTGLAIQDIEAAKLVCNAAHNQ